MTASPALAQAREPLPGGGGVIIPSPYKVRTSYPSYASRAPDVLVGYKNWRSTMSGHPECDGMVAVGVTASFKDLSQFVVSARGGLSNQWSDADKIPGQAWTGHEKTYPIETNVNAELTQQLAVHRVGFFNVYDQAAHLFAMQRNGVSVAVWIYDNNGGVRAARKIAERIVASLQN